MAQPIVVGIDGSSASQAALRLAVEEARAHRTSVRAVHVWHVPEEEYLAGFVPTAEETAALRARAEKLLDDSLACGPTDPLVDVQPVLLECPSAADALIGESRSAMLLVVGSRGLHGLRELVLGSVSHACCQHAACPVLVIPAATA